MLGFVLICQRAKLRVAIRGSTQQQRALCWHFAMSTHFKCDVSVLRLYD